MPKSIKKTVQDIRALAYLNKSLSIQNRSSKMISTGRACNGALAGGTGRVACAPVKCSLYNV